MTTNETFFFRDKIPFDHLRETMLPALLQARASRRALRIWCAASSTGGALFDCDVSEGIRRDHGGLAD